VREWVKTLKGMLMSDPKTRSIVHTTYGTDDPLEARRFVEEAYGARLRVAAPQGKGGTLTLDRLQVGEVEIADLDLPLDVMMRLPGRGDYVFATVLGGRSECERDGATTRYARGDTYLGIKADGEGTADTEHLHVSTVSVPAPLLDEVAGAGGEAAGWSFTSVRPLGGSARRWRRTVREVRGLIADLDGAAAPLVIGQAGRLLAGTALTVFPNSAVAAADEREGCRDATPAALRRATGFIEANPDIDISLADVARAACVTQRTLRLAFRRHLDTTPTAYLRRVRLAQARDDLLNGSPDAGVTVSRVAVDWGFADPTRFARHYRAAYGEAPGETLGR
jgi:AraC-like DNA-binding protein